MSDLNEPNSCPLCAGTSHSESWLGSYAYNHKRFDYVNCEVCGSLFCIPMPDGETLAKMYGTGYEQQPFSEEADLIHNMKRGWADKWLKKLDKGVFVDFGCGASSRMLQTAAHYGWDPVGVEYEAGIVEKLKESLGARAYTVEQALSGEIDGIADVVYLGDVIEHLTEEHNMMPKLLRLLKPGGVLLAQGPLENNPNLFNVLMRGFAALKSNRVHEMPPYHVMLATYKGQKAFFERYKLEPLEFLIEEVEWPAPWTFKLACAGGLKALVLYFIRRISQFTTLFNKRVGNRYYFAGRLPEHK